MCNTYFAAWVPWRDPSDAVIWSIDHNHWDGVPSDDYRPTFQLAPSWPRSRYAHSSLTTSSHSWVVSASDSTSTRSSLPWNRVAYSPRSSVGLNRPAP